MGSGASKSKAVSPVETVKGLSSGSSQTQTRLNRTNSSKVQCDNTKVTSIHSSEEQHEKQNEGNLCESVGDSGEEIATLKLQVQHLEKQVGEVESSKLDLEDQIQALQERLDQEHNEAMASEEQGCTETVKIKDHCIDKLEKEAEVSQDELAKLKARYKKKLRLVNKKLFEAKQESSVKSFEMRDEIVRLSEENTKLSERLKEAESGTRKGKPRDDLDLLASKMSKTDAFDDSRTKIILELSAKMSEQDEQISDLDSQLKEKDKTIAELKEKLVLSQARADSQPRVNSSRDGGKRPVPPDVWSNRPSSESDNSRRTPTDGRSKDNTRKKNPRKKVLAGENDSADQWCEKLPKPDTDLDEDEDAGMTELKRIAAEVKRLHQKKNKKRPKQVKNGDCRESSGTSRDSGFDTFVTDNKNDRVSSGASLTTVSEKDSVVDTGDKPPSGRNSSKPSSAKSWTSATSDLSWDDSSDDEEFVKDTSTKKKKVPTATLR